MSAQVLCGYCGGDLTDDREETLDTHLHDCPKRPWWVPRLGLEREGWDTPPDAA